MYLSHAVSHQQHSDFRTLCAKRQFWGHAIQRSVSIVGREKQGFTLNDVEMVK
jgi:hypothetical protein